jgi:hypothetical protein
MRNSKLKFTILSLGIALTISLVGNIWLIRENKPPGNLLIGQAGSSLVEAVSAKEIYPLFECPCCGKSIDRCTCPMAKERKAYVDGLTETGGARDEIILAYVKKYGLNSFIDKNRQREVREKLIAAAPNDRPIISLTPDSYDFGDISQKKGIATTFFELKNEGKSDLVIDRLETSCGCTSAAIVYQGKEGPKFGMNMGQKIPKWQISIPPGQTAQLKVYYDPNFHKDFRGAAIREISVFSNDPIDFEKKVGIELNQIN